MAGGDAGILAALLHPGGVLLENSTGAQMQPLGTNQPPAEASQAESPATHLSRCGRLLPLLATRERVYKCAPREGRHERGHAVAGLPLDRSRRQAGGFLQQLPESSHLRLPRGGL